MSKQNPSDCLYYIDFIPDVPLCRALMEAEQIKAALMLSNH